MPSWTGSTPRVKTIGMVESGCLGGHDALRTPGRDQHRNLTAHQIGRHSGQPVVMALGPAKLDGNVLVVDVPSLFQTRAKAGDVVRKLLR